MEMIGDVYYATGVGNTVMVTTTEGVVLLDTGLVLQSARQLRMLKEEVSDAPVSHTVLSHSHADHIGGTRFWIYGFTLAWTYLDSDQPVKSLHVLEVALAGDPENRAALELRRQTLQA